MTEKIADDVKCVYFKISKRLWDKFRDGCHDIGFPASTYLRSMIYKELKLREDKRINELRAKYESVNR
jgi:hypothetical protein